MKPLKFPSDVKLREKYFAGADKGHPARANLYMMIWLIKKLTKPGDTILDPTSGVGSLLYATLLDRNVVNIELEKHLCDIQRLNWAFIQMNHKPTGQLVLLEGDARRYLPIVRLDEHFITKYSKSGGIDHCIFSPPYSVSLGHTGPKLMALASENGTSKTSVGGVAIYGKDRAQLATLSYFNLLVAMKEIYRGIYNSLPVGGYMCTITKDSVNTKAAKYRGLGGIEPYSADTIKVCYEVGFELYQLWQRDAKPSMRLQVAWSQNPNIPHVVTEEITIMRKPK